MTKNDWYEAGDQIKRLVQDAVDTGDFSQLGNTIADVVNDTVDGLQDAIRGRQAYERTRGRTYGQTTGQSGQGTQRYQPVKAKGRVPGEFGSKLMKYMGYGMGVVFGASLAMEAAAAAAIGDLFFFAAGGVTTGLFFAGSVLLGANGQRRLGASRRFKRYQEVIGTRTYCMIEELAAGIGESSSYVKKDLKKMIRRGYFPVGYLDRKETLLITDQSTYQQYLQAETEYEKRQSAQRMDGDESRASASAPGTADAGTEDSGKTERTPEHQALIEEGQKYIRHIHECNEKIPDAQITAKLDRLELVVTRIFREAQKNPDAVSDLRKMMSYYLPTTRKLLDAYCELDDQPIRGQNIENTRAEIERALDTINTAFEKLLDDLYEEQAWDISSDISVLNSMLAQEGLTKSAWKEMRTYKNI